MYFEAPIRIVELAPITLAGVRRQASLRSITPVAAAAPVWPRLSERGIAHGAPVLHFPDGANDALFSEPGATVDIGAEIDVPLVDPVLKLIRIPGGRAVFATHPGDHDRIGELHHAMRAFCTGRNERLAGPLIERHHWHHQADRRLTEVYYLLD